MAPALALGLAGCAGDAGDGRAGPGPQSALDEPAIAAALPVPVAVPAAAPLRVPAMATLVGYDEPALLLLLGRPGLTWREPPAEVWRYAGKACALHVFVYRAADGAARVLHVEPGRLPEGTGPAACLERLLAERRAHLRS